MRKSSKNKVFCPLQNRNGLISLKTEIAYLKYSWPLAQIKKSNEHKGLR